MANSIATAANYSQVLDEIFQKEALTRIFDKPQILGEFTGVGEVKIPKVSVQGLGSYSTTNGFTNGDITFAYETKTLTQRRARSFALDKIINAQTFDKAFAFAGGEFIRTRVIPEVDAYRVATLHSVAANKVSANLDKTTIAEAITLAEATMSEAQVPLENRVLLITPTKLRDLEGSDGFSRDVNISNSGDMKDVSYHVGTFNGMKVVQVPQARMYTEITLLDGSTSGQEGGGYTKTASTGRNINFMIVHVPSALGVVKTEEMRIFAPTAADAASMPGTSGVTQGKFAWTMDFTIYHDIFTGDNKTAGIYSHYATT